LHEAAHAAFDRLGQTEPATIAGAIAMLEMGCIADLSQTRMLASISAGLRAIAEREGIA
jgi:hypothetical protein